MKNGICPKCNSSEVHAGTTVTFKRGSYNVNTIPISFWTYATLDNYVCVRCGYVESYIAEPDILHEINQKWPRVVPTQQR